MPPRKKARTSPAAALPTATSPTPPSHAKSPSPTSPNPALQDPWTDPEETGLYKGLIKYKPTGLHKHFRLLQLRSYLLSNGYIHPYAAHTSLPGLWKKLAELYDLEALDQREDARQLSDYSEEGGEGEGEEGEGEGEDDAYSEAENKIRKDDFVLPEEEFGQAMWERRLPGKGKREESPLENGLREVNFMEEAPVGFTPGFSVEPAFEEVGTGKRGRRRPRRGGRGSAAGAQVGARRTRRLVEESAGEEDVEGSAEGESGEESSEEEEESEESTPAPRGGRTGRGRGRGRGNGAGRGRGRKR